MAFYPGQHVVCINDEGSPALRKGSVYTVTAVVEGPFVCAFFRAIDHQGLLLKEAKPTGRGNIAFSPVRFRPLDEKRLDQFKAHLAPTPAKEVVGA